MKYLLNFILILLWMVLTAILTLSLVGLVVIACEDWIGIGERLIDKLK